MSGLLDLFAFFTSLGSCSALPADGVDESIQSEECDFGYRNFLTGRAREFLSTRQEGGSPDFSVLSFSSAQSLGASVSGTVGGKSGVLRGVKVRVSSAVVLGGSLPGSIQSDCNCFLARLLVFDMIACKRWWSEIWTELRFEALLRALFRQCFVHESLSPHLH